ncbi:MAG: SDR family oxidoreductase [Gemmatimonadota bacterium]|nr:SDR family oxidoreductase [Gemmatimonadota bacterium]
MDLGIAGRRALVCGSTQGLGRAIAARLVAEGCRVALNGRTEDRTTAAAEALARETGGDVIGLAGDVGDQAAVATLVSRAETQFGGVDILVCNSGGPPSVLFADAQPDQWQGALDVSLLSTIHLCRAAVPGMRSRHWGRVICLTSVAAKQAVPGLILSTTARAGVLGFAKTLADEVAADGVTVNTVCPGYMRTERLTELMDVRAARAGRTPADVSADLVRTVPAGRIGDPDELAAAVAFLASEPARYITGAVLQVDGGSTRSIF